MIESISRHPHRAIRASAGSGKTFQLTNRYLTLLLAGEPVDRIVAMTFTRKAAGEICERLLTRLAGAVRDPVRCASLARELGEPSLDPERATLLLTSLVSQLHRVRIFTIDAFFAGIAANFALDVGLPIHWTLADQDLEQRLREQAVTETLRGDPKRGTDLFRLFNRGQSVRSVSERIGDTIASTYDVFLESSASAWHQLAKPSGFDHQEVGRRIEELAAEATGDSSLDEAVRRIVHLARKGDFASVFGETLAKNVLRGERKYSRSPVADSVADPLDRLLMQARSVVGCALADQTEATYSLLEQFDVYARRLKLARSALSFDDISRALAHAALLERLDDVSFRLDARIAHLLLDEFQDTSRWDPLESTCRHASLSIL